MPAPELAWLWRTPWMRRLGGWGFGKLLGPGNAEALLELGWHDRKRFTEEEMEASGRYYKVRNLGRALWEYAAAGEPNELPERVGELKVPLLVITGANDKIVPPGDSAELAKSVPQGTEVIVDECGHLPQEEQPEAFIKAISEFYETIRERKGSRDAV
ncbi:Alpha/Beta hydrolase protein [Hyaloraphidium curvatum]|nr:Alpha/Beta hydrolase protein [Hyaloraphidium curvatum]